MAKITHVCLANFYCEGYTYQENMLPRFHCRMGYDVDVIASLVSFDSNGRSCLLPVSEDYMNADGIHVTRLNYRSNLKVDRIFRRYAGFHEALEKSSPDILFVHGAQSAENVEIARYMRKHPEVKLFVDNHADYSNSATNWLSKYVLHRVVWKHYAQMLVPYAERFWGVLPARVDFLVDNYGIPRDKCSLLAMGADDDEVSRATASGVCEKIRSSLGFNRNDFVVVTGGKIDKAKIQTLLLMEAVLSMGDNVKLLIFGPVDPDLKPEFEHYFAPNKMVYVPWADSSAAYDYFAVADVACFPGRHSVYWEQAVGIGIPLIVKRWSGTDHINVCGNVLFLDRDSSHEIAEKIEEVKADLAGSRAFLDKAHAAASSFKYSDIARKAILLNNKNIN